MPRHITVSISDDLAERMDKLRDVNWFRVCEMAIGSAIENDQAFLRWIKLKDYVPLYIVKCPEHGLYVTYPMHESESLDCPDCIAIKKRKKRSTSFVSYLD